MKKLLFLLLVLPVFFISCQKEMIDMEEAFDELQLKSENGEREGQVCFEIQFPLTLILPNGRAITGSSRAELSRMINRWHQENRQREKVRLEIQYPVQVLFKGQLLTLENVQQMERVKNACGSSI